MNTQRGAFKKILGGSVLSSLANAKGNAKKLHGTALCPGTRQHRRLFDYVMTPVDREWLSIKDSLLNHENWKDLTVLDRSKIERVLNVYDDIALQHDYANQLMARIIDKADLDASQITDMMNATGYYIDSIDDLYLFINRFDFGPNGRLKTLIENSTEGSLKQELQNPDKVRDFINSWKWDGKSVWGNITKGEYDATTEYLDMGNEEYIEWFHSIKHDNLPWDFNRFAMGKVDMRDPTDLPDDIADYIRKMTWFTERQRQLLSDCYHDLYDEETMGDALMTYFNEANINVESTIEMERIFSSLPYNYVESLDIKTVIKSILESDVQDESNGTNLYYILRYAATKDDAILSDDSLKEYLLSERLNEVELTALMRVKAENIAENSESIFETEARNFVWDVNAALRAQELDFLSRDLEEILLESQSDLLDPPSDWMKFCDTVGFDILLGVGIPALCLIAWCVIMDCIGRRIWGCKHVVVNNN